MRALSTLRATVLLACDEGRRLLLHVRALVIMSVPISACDGQRGYRLGHILHISAPIVPCRRGASMGDQGRAFRRGASIPEGGTHYK